ncbi:nuclear factor NF-kappa-B p105 subunit isoform X1 [Triplophysa dalaica]|uniref:nuclear factor NF-kappa-B p105 subunit isoform X1 n=2 Tax=Triplophysa dalaica TaxID=1582913 RepID=UPI0024DFF779|nr:nuclear factor NF-kappa-B p105 subunit isoform X1 [Triplophysa dalaica]
MRSLGIMAGDDPYLPSHTGYMEQLEAYREDPIWISMDPAYQPMQLNNSLRAVDAPYLQIVEQPKQRGFRFRYGCEGPSHGGLPGASSEKNRKSYPQVKISNYQGAARVVVQLVTNNQPPHLHAHSLVGKQCEKGICIADQQSKDLSISFPNLGILHVTKKNVTKILEERMIEAYRMGYNYGVFIHSEIDTLQGEVRMPRELTDHERNLISTAAAQQSKEMDLSVVRLMFTALLPDSDGGFSRRLDPVISEPIFDSKAPNASNLKIVRMDRTAGCVTGGEEVYLLCDKVQKDDIQVRFYEDDDSGLTWEAYGDFSPTDVHRQFAIVFKTPKYRDQNLQKPISVFVQLKRKSDNETSEPKPFTYHPQIIDKEEVQRKRQKTLPHFQDYSGAGGGAGGMFRGGGGGSTAGGGPSGGGHYFQGYQNYNNYGSGFNFSPGMGGAGTSIKHTTQEPVEDSDEDSNSDDGDGPAGGGVVQICAQLELADHRVECESTELTEDLESDGTECAIDPHLAELAKKQAEALFRYALSGDPRMLLAPQRPLMTTQDENGDTGLHLGVIHSQTDAVRNFAQIISALPGADVLNMRNDLYQTPLHLAVVTQQKEVVEALMAAEADVTLADRNGNTALHLAAQHKEASVLQSLLKHKSALQLTGIPNTAGLCPLHLAVRVNSLSCVRALLELSADAEVQELTCGRTALHLAIEMDNLSLSGCLLLEGNANVDSVTYNGSTPLHVAAGRGSTKLSALLMAAGADPHKENFEPLFFKDDETCEPCDEEEEDEGYIPGTTPMNVASSPEVYDILNGQEYQPTTVFVPPQGDMDRLSCEVKQDLCQALEEQAGGWESLARALGLGILTSAFRLSSSPAGKLLDSYEVSGGMVHDLIEGLKQVGNSCAVSLLQSVCKETNVAQAPPQLAGPELYKAIQGLTLGRQQEEGGICDSGVETSF